VEKYPFSTKMLGSTTFSTLIIGNVSSTANQHFRMTSDVTLKTG